MVQYLLTQHLLKKNGIEATIAGREKTPFSIWRKIQNKKISLEQLTDIIGFRVIVKNVEECYKTLGIFHSKFSTIPGKFKDYISSPKINGYKSLHTSVIGSNKKPIEIQIRTHEMHEFAERGVASHWKYKSSEKFNSLEIITTFQSRFGPQEWLKPYTDKTLESLPKEGKKNILTICPGFSSDCVETLEEILIQGKESFMNSGGENFDMIPCLNDNDDHIFLLKSLIQRSI